MDNGNREAEAFYVYNESPQFIDADAVALARQQGWAPISRRRVTTIPKGHAVVQIDKRPDGSREVTLIGVLAKPQDHDSFVALYKHLSEHTTQNPEMPPDRPFDLSSVVSSQEIGDRLGVKASTVTTWARRHADFPEPLGERGGVKLWELASVERWASRREHPSNNGRTEPPPQTAV